MTKATRPLFGPGVAACLLAGSLPALGQTTVVETFESYSASADSVLDPTTVGGSGWTRDQASNTNALVAKEDWSVTCCTGEAIFRFILDETFDGSSKFLSLRRSTSASSLPESSDENTDFAIPTMSEGYVSLEMNPAAVSGDGFRMALRDSGSGSNAMEIVHTEQGWPVINSGDFRVLDENGATLAEGTIPNDPDTDNPTAVHRWFKILVVLHGNGTYDVNVFDIGPTFRTQTGVQGYGDPARGLVLSLIGASLPVPSVDTFRLTPGSTNGGGQEPTLIDNIIASDSAGASLEIGEFKTGDEISFPTQAGKVYLAEFSDDAPTGTWSQVGLLILGDGTTQSAVASTAGAPSNRTYRVLEF